MKERTPLSTLLVTLAVCALAAWTTHAQSTWTNTPGGEWNDIVGWDFGVPAEFNAGVIPVGNAVTYDTPMAAGNILGLTLGGTLTVNTNAFNIDPLGGTALSILNGGFLTVNSDGVIAITNAGAFRMMDRNALMAVDGGTLVFAGNLGAITIGENGNTTTTWLTNNFGSITADQSFQLRGRFTGFHMTGGTLDLLGGGGVYETSNDQERRFQIDGGTANLGDFNVSRTTSGGGLLVNNGVVTASSLRIGTWASRAYSDVYGGTLTVTGDFTVCDRNNGATSGDRSIRFFVRGGEVISTSTNGIVVANQSNTGAAGASVIRGLLEVRDNGTLTAEKITLVGSTGLSNAHARFNLTGNAVVNLGAGGLVGNVGVDNTSYSAELNGGTLAAKDDFTVAADLTPGGGNLQAEDGLGTARNITLTGGLIGAGTLNKTGGGSLILQGASTHSGDINVNEGTLSLQGDTIASTLNIVLAAGTTFDVGAGYSLANAQTLSGEGTVSNDVAAASGSTIRVAGLTTIGTLTFTDDLTENGGAVNEFNVSSASQDQIVVQGALNLSNTNTILVNTVGSVPSGSYLLIDYGTLSGDTSNLELVGVTGSLSNSVTEGAIYLVLDVERPATNLVWVGDSVLNQWDTGTSSNWVNGATTYTFLAGDEVTFDNSGSTTPSVDLVGDLTPASVTVDASVDYTFAGAGKVTGLSSLTKTNSGKLTILTTNDYVGVTTVAGGTLSVSNLANGGLASPIGAAAADAANLVLDGGALEYQGATLTWDRGMTLGAAGAGVSIGDVNAALRTTGPIAGDGKLTKTGAGQLDIRAVNSYAGGTEVQSGTLRLDRDSGATLGTNVLTLNGSASAVTFQFGGDTQVLPNTLQILGTNNATLNNGNNTVNDIVGNGAVRLGAGGTTLTIQGDMSTFSGALIADGLPNLRFNPGTGSSNAVFDLGAGACMLNNRNGNLTIQLGSLLGGPSTILQGASSANNPTTYVIGALNQDMLFEGTISEVSINRIANIVKVGSGTLTLSGNSTHTGDTTISRGTLALKDAAFIGSTANITVAAGTTLDVSGLFTPVLYLNFGQTLKGNGTVNGSVDTSAGGVVSPGTSIGTLTVTNDAALFGTTVMEINRSAAQKADKIVAATIELAGILDVQNIGFNLQVGDTFDLFDGVITDFGVFIQGPAGVSFSPVAADGTITVTAAPVPPQITGTSLLSGTNLVCSGTGGVGFGNYRVLASTNVAAPLPTWTQVLTGSFDFDGTFSFTNVVDPAKPKEFFILQGQ